MDSNLRQVMRRCTVIIACLTVFCGILTASEPFLFVQLSDTQFGMYEKDRGFAQETANLEFAVATINRLNPTFVVITGDLVNKAGEPRRGQRTNTGIPGGLPGQVRTRLLQLPAGRSRDDHSELVADPAPREGNGRVPDAGELAAHGASNRQGIRRQTDPTPSWFTSLAPNTSRCCASLECARCSRASRIRMQEVESGRWRSSHPGRSACRWMAPGPGCGSVL